MKKNMGILDRTVRILIAVIVVILYFTNVITGTLAGILLALAGIFVITSIFSTCPLYMPFGIRTKKKEGEAPPPEQAAHT
jgi:uncharacterized SAM-binding protein YcdF (DUF218 family)